MEQIIIHKGEKKLEISQNRGYIVNSMKRTRKLMEKDNIIIRLRTTQSVDFEIGSVIYYQGDKYTLNLNPTVKKLSSFEFEYTLSFEGLLYDLYSSQYFNTDILNWYSNINFSLTGNLETFAKVAVNNANRAGNYIWILGEMPQTSIKTLQFNKQNVLNALKQVSQEYEVYFNVEVISEMERKLTVIKPEPENIIKLQYGQSKGLYEILRKNKNKENPINRLFIYGSERNLPPGYRTDDYRSARLLPVTGMDYIESSDLIEAFGRVNEGILILDDIYPQRTGSVTGLTSNKLEFIDSSMDFDLNEYLAPGLTAKVHFNSGNLSGYEFEIESYNHSNKKFKLIPFGIEQGGEIPSMEPFNISYNDKYKLIDIYMPESYVTEAEEKLYNEGKKLFNYYAGINSKVDLKITDRFIKNLDKPLKLGNLVNVIDQDLNINDVLQITEIVNNIYVNGAKAENNTEIKLDVPKELPEYTEPLIANLKFIVHGDGEEREVSAWDFCSNPNSYLTFEIEANADVRYNLKFYKNDNLRHRYPENGKIDIGNWCIVEGTERENNLTWTDANGFEHELEIIQGGSNYLADETGKYRIDAEITDGLRTVNVSREIDITICEDTGPEVIEDQPDNTGGEDTQDGSFYILVTQFHNEEGYLREWRMNNQGEYFFKYGENFNALLFEAAPILGNPPFKWRIVGPLGTKREHKGNNFILATNDMRGILPSVPGYNNTIDMYVTNPGKYTIFMSLNEKGPTTMYKREITINIV